VLIIRNSLAYSRKTGIWTALGFSLGNLVHITLAVFGISIIIQSSPLAFTIIKFLGAGYLIYLGIKTLLLKIEAQKADNPTGHKDISVLQAVKIGFLTNISSTGAYLFFASIFSTVLSSGSPFWVILSLAVAMPLNTFVMASILTFFFTQKNVKNIYGKFQHIINKCLGAALILLALMALFHK
jgi:threonine/homoserine/homoserine lactone efflux protein